MSGDRIRMIAEDCVEIGLSGPREAQRIGDSLRKQGLFEDVVPGMSSLAARFDPEQMKMDDAIRAITEASDAPVEHEAAEALPSIDILVRYGGKQGPDLGRVCELLDISEKSFIEAHTNRKYPVDLIGFTPGFAYLGGLPESLSVPRLDTPRARLPAGSVGISPGYTGLYAMKGPGGWSIVGHTEHVLFDTSRTDPFVVRPGMQVRFRAA